MNFNTIKAMAPECKVFWLTPSDGLGHGRHFYALYFSYCIFGVDFPKKSLFF